MGPNDHANFVRLLKTVTMKDLADPGIIQWLIKQGENINNDFTETRSAKTANQDNPDIVQLLIKEGKNINNDFAATLNAKTANQDNSLVEPVLKKSENTDEKEKDLCIICEEREINTVYVPCGHRLVCLLCADEMEKRDHIVKCPNCSEVREVIKTFGP